MSDHHQRYSQHHRRHRHHWEDAELSVEIGCGNPAFADAVHAQARRQVEEYDAAHKPCDTCGKPTCGGLSCKGSKTGMLSADAPTRHAHGSPGSTPVRLTDVPWVAHTYREAPASGNSTGI